MIKNRIGIFRKALGVLLTVSALFSGGAALRSDAASQISPAAEYVRGTDSSLFCSYSAVGKVLGDIEGRKVYAGGFPFGVKMYTEGLLIIGFADVNCSGGSVAPAKDAGMQLNDIIIRANDTELDSAEEFIEIIENSNGEAVTLMYLRDNVKHECKIRPSISEDDGKYKTGMWLRDSTAGIGTVTFVVPETGAFAGLGHGICDSETGTLIPLARGTTSGVSISGIKKGRSGSPGELQGSFNGEKTGSLLSNTDNGVFGIFLKDKISSCEVLPIGSRYDIKDGDAYILCTLDDNKIGRYSISVSEIHRDSKGNKNFIVTVTDKKLIEKTGGIVQGMSGSPIIQDGKLVGAVTHVLVNDPTKGYGIFIENMLDAAS